MVGVHGITAAIFVLESVFGQRSPACVFQHAVVWIVSDLSERESMRDQEVKFFIGTAAGQEEADASGVD